jgi:hypothetical protein
LPSTRNQKHHGTGFFRVVERYHPTLLLDKIKAFPQKFGQNTFVLAFLVLNNHLRYGNELRSIAFCREKFRQQFA